MSKIKNEFGPKSQSEIDSDISKHFGVDDIYDNSTKDLPDYKKEDIKLKEDLKQKFEKRKQILINQSEGIKKMMKIILAILKWLPKIKNIATTVFGFVGALAYFLQEYYSTNGNPKWYQVAVAVAIFVIGYFTGKPGIKQTPKDLLSVLFAISIGYVLETLLFAQSTIPGVSFAAITALTGQTKAASQKTSRQRGFSVKEASADSAVSCPPDCLKSLKVNLKGINDQSAFGEETIGQEITGEVVIYAAETAIRTFCHELVTKKIEYFQGTTNSGQAFAFSTSDATPAVRFAYDDATLISDKDEPTVIKLKITGFRDNLAMS